MTGSIHSCATRTASSTSRCCAAVTVGSFSPATVLRATSVDIVIRSCGVWAPKNCCIWFWSRPIVAGVAGVDPHLLPHLLDRLAGAAQASGAAQLAHQGVEVGHPARPAQLADQLTEVGHPPADPTRRLPDDPRPSAAGASRPARRSRRRHRRRRRRAGPGDRRNRHRRSPSAGGPGAHRPDRWTRDGPRPRTTRRRTRSGRGRAGGLVGQGRSAEAGMPVLSSGWSASSPWSGRSAMGVLLRRPARAVLLKGWTTRQPRGAPPEFPRTPRSGRGLRCARLGRARRPGRRGGGARDGARGAGAADRPTARRRAPGRRARRIGRSTGRG